MEDEKEKKKDHEKKEEKEKPVKIHKATRKDFQKLKFIGRGDVADVFLVKHRKSGKVYAMKVLVKSQMIARNKVKRALTEREILATANHPFIMTLYYSFQTKKKLYFIMEYCGGGEFFKVLQNQPAKCLPENYARFYSAEVLLALEYLHLQGFIYRDLKPENLLLSNTGHVVLTDFDLSKRSTNQVTPTVVTQMFTGRMKDIDTRPDVISNSFVGTEEYIAPEVIEGFGHTSSVDWWTFGILLYEMLFGFTPFRGRTREDTFNFILKSGGVKFPEKPPISYHGKNIVKKLLEKDPRKRLGSEHGAADIKEHPWFKGKINFALIRNLSPPILPKIPNFRDMKPEEGLGDSSDEEKKTKRGKDDENARDDDDDDDDDDDVDEDDPFKSRFPTLERKVK